MPNSKKILLIEDEAEIVEMYTMVFREAGFEVESALSGNEAREKINKIDKKGAIKLDLILLDLTLPDISGLELLRDLRNSKKTQEIPVIVLSNYTSEDIKKECQNLGIDEYIVKVEVTPQELVEIIKRKF